MTPSPFEIPEVVSLIARFLTQREMSSCMATCRIFYENFLPCRWEYFNVPCVIEEDIHSTEQDRVFSALFERPAGPEAAVIVKNRHHLQSINIRVFADAFLRNFVGNEISPTSSTLEESFQGQVAVSLPYPSSTPAFSTASPPSSSCTCAPLTQGSSAKLGPPLRGHAVMGLRKLHIDTSHLEAGSRWRDKDVIPPTRWLLRLLGTNANITDLLLPASILYEQWVVGNLASLIIYQLPQLKRLTFGKDDAIFVPFEHVPPLLHTLCQHKTLRDLHCHFSTLYQGDSPAEYFSNVSPDLLTAPSLSLRTLTLPYADFLTNLVPRFLTNCVPHLEDLEVPPIPFSEALLLLTPLEILGASSLKHLRFESWNAGLTIPVAVQVVLACKQVRSFRAKSLHYADALMMALLRQHAQTLEIISLHRTGFFLSEHIHKILCKCPRLKEFSVARHMWDSALRLRDLTMKDGPGEWTCLGLKTLRLVICRSAVGVVETGVMNSIDRDDEMASVSDVEPDKGDNAMLEDHISHAGDGYVVPRSRPAAVGVRNLYRQIGQLSKLEVLELRYDCLDEEDPEESAFERDLTLHEGLGQLANLKSLRELVLIHDLWSAMGQDEMEFMVANWPRLEMVAFGVDVKNHDWESPEFEHWRWLQRQRPSVKFVFLDDNDQEI